MLTFALGVALALVPKCPMCIAAYLSLAGFGMAAAGTIAPLCLPVGVALMALSGVLAWRSGVGMVWRRPASRLAPSEAAGSGEGRAQPPHG